MNALSWFSALVAISMIAISVMLPAPFLFAGDELVQLHSKVQGLASQVSQLERALDENIGVTADLINRNAETISNIQRDTEQLKSHLEQQNRMAERQIDKISEEIRTWQAEMDKLKGRLEAATRPSSPPIAPPVAPQALSAASSPPSSGIAGSSPHVDQARAGQAQTGQGQAAQVHPSETLAVVAPPQTESAGGPDLYRSAMDHYASKDYEIAATEFAKFLKIDHQSENAANARYYLAEIEYEDKDFEGALDDYTAVGPRLSDTAKAARAQYRKALCLIEVNREDEAALELQDVIARFPRSPEAAQAARKLRTLKGRSPVHP